MSLITKSIIWATVILLVALAGATQWLDKSMAWALITTLPCFAVIHLGVAAKSDQSCQTDEARLHRLMGVR